MAAPKGNQFWKLIKPEDLGRNPKYKTPEELWKDVMDYFQECDDSPITTSKTTTGSKGSFYNEDELIVPYTWEGLYVFLGICDLDHYKKKEAFSAIITHIGNIIRNQKYTGAAIGIFNNNIIARDLGLKDKSDLTTNDKEIGIAPIEWVKQK